MLVVEASLVYNFMRMCRENVYDKLMIKNMIGGW